jgi:hypothetical protein
MNLLCQLEHWGRGFQSLSRHVCLCACILCFCCPVCLQVVALRRADPPSKESYHVKDLEFENAAKVQRRAVDQYIDRKGLAIAQAVSRWFPTVAALVSFESSLWI